MEADIGVLMESCLDDSTLISFLNIDFKNAINKLNQNKTPYIIWNNR